METLLIATDFSPAAHNAALYGIELAKFLDAKVALLHVSLPVLAEAGIVTPEALKRSAEELLRKEVHELQAKGPVDIDMFVEEGMPAETTIWFANKIKAKWIIAGMKGTGTTFRKIFGSTVTSLSRKTDIPLIVVPDDARFTCPKRIALASDINHETDLRILDPLEEFGEKCQAAMYVVRVIEKGMDDLIERLLRPSRIKWHCKELHPSFEFVNSNNVVNAINEFVKEHHVDLVAMISAEHTIWERIFVKSDIKQMIFHTKIPLIILPGDPHTGALEEFENGAVVLSKG